MRYWDYLKKNLPEIYVDTIKEELDAGNLDGALGMLYLLGKRHADSEYFADKENTMKFCALIDLIWKKLGSDASANDYDKKEMLCVEALEQLKDIVPLFIKREIKNGNIKEAFKVADNLSSMYSSNRISMEAVEEIFCSGYEQEIERGEYNNALAYLKPNSLFENWFLVEKLVNLSLKTGSKLVQGGDIHTGERFFMACQELLKIKNQAWDSLGVPDLIEPVPTISEIYEGRIISELRSNNFVNAISLLRRLRYHIGNSDFEVRMIYQNFFAAVLWYFIENVLKKQISKIDKLEKEAKYEHIDDIMDSIALEFFDDVNSWSNSWESFNLELERFAKSLREFKKSFTPNFGFFFMFFYERFEEEITLMLKRKKLLRSRKKLVDFKRLKDSLKKRISQDLSKFSNVG